MVKCTDFWHRVVFLFLLFISVVSMYVLVNLEVMFSLFIDTVYYVTYKVSMVYS